MAGYELRFKASVAKDLRGVPAVDVHRILNRIQALRDEPRPQGHEKLGGQDLYRIRQGVYRIVFAINDTLINVEAIRVGHCREEYRG